MGRPAVDPLPGSSAAADEGPGAPQRGLEGPTRSGPPATLIVVWKGYRDRGHPPAVVFDKN
jgi:hypothetical protein